MASSINPTDIDKINTLEDIDIDKINTLEDIDIIKMIAITSSKEEIYKRLKVRDPGRNCSSDKFINSQLDYQEWIINNINLYQLYIDNTNNKIENIANDIVNYINNL